MISQYYPHPDNVQEESVYNPSAIIAIKAKGHDINVNEWYRRDAIIRELYKNCPYAIGDVCIPVDPKGIVKYGEVKVQEIMKSYMEVQKGDEWPKNDNPFVVTAVPLNKETHGTSIFLCTTNYLQKVTK